MPKTTSRPHTSGVRHSPRRHPVGGRVPDEPNKTSRLRGRGAWLGLLLLFGVAFLGLRGIHALADQPEQSAIFTDQIVVVGVTGRPELTQTDRAVLGAHLGDAQAGTMSIRPRYVGDCAAAGWTTLGAGRRAAVGGLCSPVVESGKIADWSARQAAAAARRGDAQLGTLAGSTKGCIAAVGPGAALAAAKPDGTVAAYQSAEEFVSTGMRTTCPITIVDAGQLSDQVITELANRKDVTLIVTGVGPNDGSDDPSLQVVYRLGTTLPGWLTSASTRREGIVTLTDLTRTLIEFGGPASSVAVDGSPFAVYDAGLSVERIDTKIKSVAALSNAAPIGYLALGLTGAVLFVIMVISVLRGKFEPPKLILALGGVLLAAMMLTGAVPWQYSGSAGLVVSLVVLIWLVILTLLALLVGRRAGVPAIIAAAAISVAAFTVDAALGAIMQPGSLINSRPIFGLRWYGFGNVTFAAYASAGLLLAGYIAHRCLATGRRAAALVAVGVIGFGIVICEGWPSMGSDFGGVIALTPAVLWLMLALSGARITWPKVLAIGGAAVLAVAVISVLDWLRGPDRRTHLGNFVQRILDGDALDVISRKALASAETIAAPVGIGSLLVGVLLWIVIFRFVVPRISTDFTTLRSTLIAALLVAILGTVLNDGGIFVWLTVTGEITATVGWFFFDWADRNEWTPSPLVAAHR
jgi:nucleotide-binding universal stress UspA family protein